jgi:outer membrane biosynthesis protein TonB
MIQGVVDERGTPTCLKVTESIPELDVAALECAARMRFKPAEKDGKPVPVVAVMPVLLSMQ